MDKVTLSPSLIQNAGKSFNISKPVEKTGDKSSSSFGELLTRSIEEVNSQQVDSEVKVSEFLAGRDNGIHQTMLSMEKADISMRLLVKVRNKAVEAYREIMRLQV